MSNPRAHYKVMDFILAITYYQFFLVYSLNIIIVRYLRKKLMNYTLSGRYSDKTIRNDDMLFTHFILFSFLKIPIY